MPPPLRLARSKARATKSLEPDAVICPTIANVRTISAARNGVKERLAGPRGRPVSTIRRLRIPDHLPEPISHYTDAVVADGRIWISGMLALDKEGTLLVVTTSWRKQSG